MVRETPWDVSSYAANTRFVSDLGQGALELLEPRAGERIVDLGCGDGALTRRLLEAHCDVLGVDASEQMVSAARAAGVEARCLDAHELEFDQQFDAVFSNAALHWMRRPQAVSDGVFRALKPGGRFVGEMGGQGNVARLRAAMHHALRQRGIDPDAVDPWYFPTSDEYAAVLRHSGFRVAGIVCLPRPTALPTGIGGWMEAVARPFLLAVSAAERRAFVDEVERALAPELKDAQGGWWADYVRLRFKAVKPA